MERRLCGRVARITSPDHSLNRAGRRSRDQRIGIRDLLIGITAAAECIVADLSALLIVNLTGPNNNQLRTWALLIESVDLVRNVLCTLLNRRAIAITACGWVVDSFGCGAWVSFEDCVDEGA